jgi:hypothetical protein
MDALAQFASHGSDVTTSVIPNRNLHITLPATNL